MPRQSGDVSAYFQSLIAKDLKQKSREELEAKLLVGVESLNRGEGRELTEADWKRLRQQVKEAGSSSP